MPSQEQEHARPHPQDAVPPQDADSGSAQELIRALGLLPHPEGGYYRETYRSAHQVDTAAGLRRSACTAIYYLLDRHSHSAWHRIASDEIWHFHLGAALHVHVLDGQGGVCSHLLGDPLRQPGAACQVVVPAGSWFGAELAPQAGAAAYALAGCTVAPGFEFSEFELADPAALLREYPQHEALVRRLAPR